MAVAGEFGDRRERRYLPQETKSRWRGRQLFSMSSLSWFLLDFVIFPHCVPHVWENSSSSLPTMYISRQCNLDLGIIYCVISMLLTHSLPPDQTKHAHPSPTIHRSGSYYTQGWVPPPCLPQQDGLYPPGLWARVNSSLFLLRYLQPNTQSLFPSSVPRFSSTMGLENPAFVDCAGSV